MPDNATVSHDAIVSHDRVKEAVYTLLRTAVHIERRFTAEQISEMSGVPIASVRSYMKGTAAERREPSLSYALSLAVVLGERAVNSFLAIIGYAGAHPTDEAEADRPAMVAATVMGEVARFAKCAADNRIDHAEEPIAREAADNVIQLLSGFSSQGRAA